MKKYNICLLPGDGIGPEVIDQAERALKALPVEFSFTRAEIGYGAYEKHGTPLPDESLEGIIAADASLMGAVTTPTNLKGYRSPVIKLRQTLDLYANIRPCISLPHPASRQGIKIMIVRENTEGLYAGRERTENGGSRAVSERVITRYASERIIRKAFETAIDYGCSKLTVVHKANILRETCGLFRKTALDVAQEFPNITLEEMLVDTCAMELVRAPEQFEVIVTTNLFGDILSDEASALVGGLGIACSANIGDHCAVFEPVHGSAPTIAGKDLANPIAAILSAALMLESLGEKDAAAGMRSAVDGALRAGLTTPDMGGSLSTAEACAAIIDFLSIPQNEAEVRVS